MEKVIEFELTNDEALVLFEFFCRFDESNQTAFEDTAEEIALQRLLGRLEKALVEPFDPTYSQLVDGARGRL